MRGEIRWANLNPTIGHEQSGIRPVFILSSNIFNSKSGTVIAVAITSKKPRAGFPLTLPLEGIELPKASWVKVSQVRNLSVERIGEKIDQASEEIVIQVIEGLNEIFGM